MKHRRLPVRFPVCAGRLRQLGRVASSGGRRAKARTRAGAADSPLVSSGNVPDRAGVSVSADFFYLEACDPAALPAWHPDSLQFAGH